jgi:predicted nucleic acid-binding protein
LAVIYLADKSAWQQARFESAAAETFRKLQNGFRLAICPVIAAELLFSARNHKDFMASRADYDTLVWLDTTTEAQRRMLDVMQALARRRQHRSVGIPDLLVAATAELSGARCCTMTATSSGSPRSPASRTSGSCPAARGTADPRLDARPARSRRSAHAVERRIEYV